MTGDLLAHETSPLGSTGNAPLFWVCWERGGPLCLGSGSWLAWVLGAQAVPWHQCPLILEATWLQRGENLSVTLWVPKKTPPPKMHYLVTCENFQKGGRQNRAFGKWSFIQFMSLLSESHFLKVMHLWLIIFSTFSIFQIRHSNGSSYLYLSCFPFSWEKHTVFPYLEWNWTFLVKYTSPGKTHRYSQLASSYSSVPGTVNVASSCDFYFLIWRAIVTYLLN